MNEINVKAFAEKWREEIKNEIKAIGAEPKLLIVSIGIPDEASKVYVKNKVRLASKVGIKAEHYIIGGNQKASEYTEFIEGMMAIKDYDGVIIQKPAAIDDSGFEEVTSCIPHYADVDCLTDENAGRLFKGNPLYRPATVEGVLRLLKSEFGSIEGEDIAILGRSNIVGRPMAATLEQAGATVTVFHSKSVDTFEKLRNKDIVISAVGKADLFDYSSLSEWCTVVDVGINRVDGKLCGDFNHEIEDGFAGEAYAKNIRYTPVPNGVGLLTTTALMYNVLKAWKLQYC